MYVGVIFLIVSNCGINRRDEQFVEGDLTQQQHKCLNIDIDRGTRLLGLPGRAPTRENFGV